MSRLLYYRNQFESRVNREFWSERELSFGNSNQGKVIYIIRRNDSTAGLFSYYTYVLGHMKYAINSGWYPVVDMQHYNNLYLNSSTIGTHNAWDYYFKQPCNIKLKEAYHSSRVILSSGAVPSDMPNVGLNHLNESVIEEWKKLSDMIPCESSLIEMANLECKKLGIYGQRVLGVMLRGTDYIALKPKNHPKQPTAEEAVERIKQLMFKYNYNKVYLSTEDEGILQHLKFALGDKLIYSRVERYKSEVKGLLKYEKINRKNDSYQRGVDYIIPMLVLSKCTSLFAGRTSGSVSLPLLKTNYEVLEYWDSGVY